MQLINARNVNDAFIEGLWWLRTVGKVEQSRNGPVIVAPNPVMTVYHKPEERVLFHPLRDCNPFFHLFESVWMLAGSNDVRFLTWYNKNMATFSDDGETLDGAYGYRWRVHFGFDQLFAVIHMLKRDPTTRRAVIAMWDPEEDFYPRKDIPCNTHIYFRVIPGEEQLDMTVCCRSNDVIWGAYGANAVHFSFLQEFVAGAAGLRVGRMYQLSNNYHAYVDLEVNKTLFSKSYFPVIEGNPYDRLEPIPIGATVDNWEETLGEYVAIAKGGEPPANSKNKFTALVLWPMWTAWRYHKDGNPKKAQEILVKEGIIKVDWLTAGYEWLGRRQDKLPAGQ